MTTNNVEKETPHEMLSVRTGADGKLEVRINYSSLSIISTCKRKAEYALKRGLRNDKESPALTFGSSVHKALEVWYCAPRASRKESSSECDDSQALMLAGSAPLPHGQCVRCAAVFTFIERGVLLRMLSNDKRSLANGIDTLNAYFDHYAKDPFVIAHDDMGPICERKFELTLSENDERRIIFFGTIDAVLKNEETGVTLVCDHKTTSALGADFYNRVRPNFQYYGYVLAAQRALGLSDVDLFMSNGIQVAKTKKEFARQITKVSAEDFEELTFAVEDAVDDYLICDHRNAWPMTAPDPCTMWGACTYRQICEVPRALKETVISSFYGNGN